jgi:3'-phosphoadenosine 5'-phosphosulfate sulfotransferase (PAPS reductase)/FAD synthetase
MVKTFLVAAVVSGAALAASGPAFADATASQTASSQGVREIGYAPFSNTEQDARNAAQQDLNSKCKKIMKIEGSNFYMSGNKWTGWIVATCQPK